MPRLLPRARRGAATAHARNEPASEVCQYRRNEQEDARKQQNVSIVLCVAGKEQNNPGDQQHRADHTRLDLLRSAHKTQTSSGSMRPTSEAELSLENLLEEHDTFGLDEPQRSVHGVTGIVVKPGVRCELAAPHRLCPMFRLRDKSARNAVPPGLRHHEYSFKKCHRRRVSAVHVVRADGNFDDAQRNIPIVVLHELREALASSQQRRHFGEMLVTGPMRPKLLPKFEPARLVDRSARSQHSALRSECKRHVHLALQPGVCANGSWLNSPLDKANRAIEAKRWSVAFGDRQMSDRISGLLEAAAMADLRSARPTALPRSCGCTYMPRTRAE
jgi:hypothetical protein